MKGKISIDTLERALHLRIPEVRYRGPCQAGQHHDGMRATISIATARLRLHCLISASTAIIRTLEG